MSKFTCNNDCAFYKGDCGHHFHDSQGHIVWGVPSESMYDGVIGDIPKCFEPSEEYKKRHDMETVKELAKTYSVDILRLAIAEKEKEIPKKVLLVQYAPHDFCNYGKCPTCNNTVEGQSISGHTDETCPKCGQRLEWE